MKFVTMKDTVLSEWLVWLGWCRGETPASVVTYDEFDGECIPPGDVIVREDVLGHFGHVLRMLLPQDLYPFLIAIYTYNEGSLQRDQT